MGRQYLWLDSSKKHALTSKLSFWNTTGSYYFVFEHCSDPAFIG